MIMKYEKKKSRIKILKQKHIELKLRTPRIK